MATGFTVWFTGLSGAGKTTLARRLESYLIAQGCRVEVLDGDLTRTALGRSGFSRADRDWNVRCIGYIADLLSRNGVVVLVAAISPYRDARARAKRMHVSPLIEVFVDCPLDVLIERDVKGLYRQALTGEIQSFTGVSDPYEPPLTADLHLRTDVESLDVCMARL